MHFGEWIGKKSSSITDEKYNKRKKNIVWVII